MIFVLAPKIYLFLRGFSSRMGECRGEFFAKKELSYKYSFFNLPILVFYILHHLPVQAIHWNYFRPAPLLQDG